MVIEDTLYKTLYSYVINDDVSGIDKKLNSINWDEGERKAFYIYQILVRAIRVQAYNTYYHLLNEHLSYGESAVSDLISLLKEVYLESDNINTLETLNILLQKAREFSYNHPLGMVIWAVYGHIYTSTFVEVVIYPFYHMLNSYERIKFVGYAPKPSYDSSLTTIDKELENFVKYHNDLSMANEPKRVRNTVLYY